jgi:PKD repeat protein
VPGAISIGHAYTSAGSYTVTVTIGDNYGASSTLQFMVTVGTAPTLTLSHNGTPIGPTASASSNVAFGISGQFTEGTASGSFSINWGDPAGNSVSNPNVQTGSVTGTSGSFAGSHTYKHKGTYTVFVTFTDANGDNVTVSFALTVS